MSEVRSRAHSLLAEMKRRRVFRVAVAYGVVAWIVIQIADIVFPALHLPEWTTTLVVVLTLLGFPLALVLAWAYDITPEGVRRTGPSDPTAAPEEQEDAPRLTEVRPREAETSSRSPSAGHREMSEGNRRTRLIVLPFQMLRPDTETDFLGFSLPDAITASLSGLQSLVVRSSLAALRFAGERSDLGALAAEAEVDMVLTGTLLRMGERLRVCAQLTAVHDGTLLWSQTSDVSLGDLFQLQDQLTHRIVESLKLPLTARERQILRHDVPANARAYEFYLRANQVAYQVSSWSTARDLYLQSVEEDPHYAPAWARLGRCYRLIAKWAVREDEYRANLQAAEAAFQRALTINPELPISHNLYAQLEVEIGRAEDALVRLLTRARANGGDPQLFAGLVHVCRFCGLLEASLAAHEQARQLDPAVTTSVAHTFYMAGDYQRVFDETFGDIGYIAPLALVALGRDEEAIRLLREAETSSADDRVRQYLASLRAMLEGDREQSLAAYEHATADLRDPEALHYQVRQLTNLGEAERAIAGFRRVVEMGFACFPFFARDSWLDPLRGRPDFREIMRKAEARHQRAAQAFREAGGEFVLGVRVPVTSSTLPAERGTSKTA